MNKGVIYVNLSLSNRILGPSLGFVRLSPMFSLLVLKKFYNILTKTFKVLYLLSWSKSNYDNYFQCI